MTDKEFSTIKVDDYVRVKTREELEYTIGSRTCDDNSIRNDNGKEAFVANMRKFCGELVQVDAASCIEEGCIKIIDDGDKYVFEAWMLSGVFHIDRLLSLTHCHYINTTDNVVYAMSDNIYDLIDYVLNIMNTTGPSNICLAEGNKIVLDKTKPRFPFVYGCNAYSFIYPVLHTRRVNFETLKNGIDCNGNMLIKNDKPDKVVSIIQFDSLYVTLSDGKVLSYDELKDYQYMSNDVRMVCTDNNNEEEEED